MRLQAHLRTFYFALYKCAHYYYYCYYLLLLLLVVVVVVLLNGQLTDPMTFSNS